MTDMKSREIKFRAWTGKEMMFEWLVARPQFADPLKVMTDPVFARELYGFEDYHLMQFTGLLDKNGKEIYEGDVIGIMLKEGVRPAWVVDWHSGYGSWGLRQIFRGNVNPAVNRCTINEWRSLEIIGNIYETPNLLTPPPDRA